MTSDDNWTTDTSYNVLPNKPNLPTITAHLRTQYDADFKRDGVISTGEYEHFNGKICPYCRGLDTNLESTDTDTTFEGKHYYILRYCNECDEEWYESYVRYGFATFKRIDQIKENERDKIKRDKERIKE